jgi:two-component system, NarL family, response regulator NreC
MLLFLGLVPAPDQDGRGKLTPRELEVLRLIALGHTSVEIARQLGLSPRTIETHRARVHRKLALATRAELVRYALQHDMLRI